MSKQWEYNAEELAHLYGTLMWSIKRISQEKGVGYTAVRKALIREGIVLRAKNTEGLHQHSEETKEKLSLLRKGEKNPNWKAKSVTDKTRELIRKNQLGKKHNDDTKKKMSETRKSRELSVGSRNPMKREECVRRWIASNNLKPNKAELKLYALLEALYQGRFVINTKGEFLILDGAIPDFVAVGPTKEVVELFGDYWHRGENEQVRIDRFSSLGYRTLIVWEKELADSVTLERKIRSFVECSNAS